MICQSKWHKMAYINPYNGSTMYEQKEGTCDEEPLTVTTTTTHCPEEYDPKDCRGGICCASYQVEGARCDGRDGDNKPDPSRNCCLPGLACRLKFNGSSAMICQSKWHKMAYINPYNGSTMYEQKEGTCDE